MRRTHLVVTLVAATTLAACGDDGGAGGDDDDTPDAADPAACDGCAVSDLPGTGCGALSGSPDSIAWPDDACAARAIALDGALVTRFDFPHGGGTRSAGGGRGFGAVVSHMAGGAVIYEEGGDAATSLVLDGEHHAIRRAEWTIDAAPFGGPGTIRLVVDWFVAAGRPHPVYAITHDLSGVGANVVSGDARSPYGEVGFDGDQAGTVDGVAWGDTHRFETLGTPLTKLNGWDYTASNAVPFAMEWIGEHDAEMGIVQTEPQVHRAAGGYWFYGARGTRDDDGPMPEDFNWPYQLNQYSFAAGESTSSTRLAWGLNFGAVGRTAYARYGDDPDNPPAGSPSGHPYQSYATVVVLGAHSATVTDAAARQVEIATLRTTVTAQVGSVVSALPGGVGRDDQVALATPGYDPRYGVFRLDAAGGAVEAVFDVDGDDALVAPVIVVRGASAEAEVRVAGEVLDGERVLRSYDAGEQTLWITVRQAWRGPVPLQISP